jgi:putative ABC transport system ATP-binding protein
VVKLSQIEFQNVFYKTVLKNISLKVEKGDYVSVIGSSGSGKSTFLKLCCHLISPTKGNILINGNDVMKNNPIELRKKISYCFQTPILFGDTVMENINYPYSIRNKTMDMERVNMLFSRFNMEPEYIDREIKNLSGGEKQRIALIRTLLFRPEVLLLDEVTSALDVDNTLIVENAVNDLNNEGVTILWVTHNLEQSRKYANKLLTIDNGEITSLEVLK